MLWTHFLLLSLFVFVMTEDCNFLFLSFLFWRWRGCVFCVIVLCSFFCFYMLLYIRKLVTSGKILGLAENWWIFLDTCLEMGVK